MKRCYPIQLLLAGLLLVTITGALPDEDDYSKRRADLVRLIEKDVRDTSLYLDKEQLYPHILGAIGKVPRHKFVPLLQRSSAYLNRPLPIGYGQTISQPYIVAVMTDVIKPEKGDRVLEIGTGSGYQAAILAELVDQVYSIEIIKDLGEAASKRLRELNYPNIRTRIGDGYYGWETYAPFDAIVVTAAASHIPPPLIRQLKPGGRMVIPVGGRFLVQQLVVVEKDSDGKVTTRQLLPVRFVPLTGKRD
ncbi:MAG: protein-L-isoaspartate(D-aspartate) O-methyltransferase [Gammaproteobacteria bacterium]|nr:MAG: protein-L-isoaspartate(D-aspartate) O-methyltransferase [Gammaproteobacteria bacterium]